MRKKAGSTQIGSIVRGLTRELALREPLFAIWEVWENVAGRPLAEHARPLRLRDGVLLVAVDSSTWMQELHYQKQILCAALRRAVPQVAVKNLHLVLQGEYAMSGGGEGKQASAGNQESRAAACRTTRQGRAGSKLRKDELENLLKRWISACRRKLGGS